MTVEQKGEVVFTKAGPNSVKSDEGFWVEVLGMAGILYREGEREIRVNSELMMKGKRAGIVVYSNSIKAWNPLYDSEAINADKKGRIVDNIRRAFQFKGWVVEVIELYDGPW